MYSNKHKFEKNFWLEYDLLSVIKRLKDRHLSKHTHKTLIKNIVESDLLQQNEIWKAEI